MIIRFFLRIVQLIVVLLLLACILLAILQTNWAKDQIRGKIVHTLKTFGIEVSAEDLSGQPPFSWTLKSAAVRFSDKRELQLSNLKLRIAIFPLFRGKVIINYLKIEKAEYSFSSASSQTTPFSLENTKALFKEQIEGLHVPFPIAIRYLAIDHFTLLDRSTSSQIAFGVLGKAMVRKDNQGFALDMHFLSPDHQMTYLEVELAGSQPKNFIETQFKVRIEENITAQFELKGPWTTWQAVIYDLPRTSLPITGSFQGTLDNPALLGFQKRTLQEWGSECPWKFNADFSIASGDQIYFKEFNLASDVAHIEGKGELFSDLETSQAMLTFSFPNLSLLSPLDFTLTGKLEGKALYHAGHFKASFETEELKCNAFSIMTAQGVIKGDVVDGKWEGQVKLSSENAQLPFENSFAFEYSPQVEFSVADFFLHIPDGHVSGSLAYAISDRLLNGDLFANIQHFNRFAAILKKENADGNFAIELQFSSQEKQQDVRCIILGQDMSYREMLLDDLTLSAEFHHLFDRPQGHLNILAEKFYSPHVYLSRLNFGTSSDEEAWPFFIDAEGRLENTFQCYAKGLWRKENPLLTVELTQLFGDLALTPFSLKCPTELEWGADYLNLSPVELRIGEGSLHSSFELSPVRSLAQWELVHFPLEILSAFKPRFALKGFASAQGFFDATPQTLTGSLHAILEEANVLHFGKKEPFRAKGTFQANLNKDRVQIQTNVSATDQQFFDLNVSLPVQHTLYPFRLTFDETLPTSGEVIAEGKLEDLFDFVNLGTNHFMGLVSCRLFLSQTLQAPSLQGNLEWQNGSFDNYFTGISLKDIQAKFEARNDLIHLVEFQAVDDKEGSVIGTGDFLLKPKEHFPYSFIAEMKNLHALGFDMIDCDVTGPLYFNGNLHNMSAQGNLLVDEALIQLTEHLPYEIPSIPVIYVNRPSHLYTKPTPFGPKFTFHLDVELSAEDKVYVEGKGLKAELQGNVHLYGANTRIVTSGALKLMKGEYQFSGKIFKLTEGEILFNDKSVPWAYLNLNGTLDLPGITITAMLRGPLASPQLTFQSNPQKPTSELLSLILFNKDITEISHTQAIQLASTLVTLTGGAGPDVLESIRKSIGVDRLNIASRKRPGEGSSDEIAVEIGKYLTRGILVTLSQSATSSQVIVEVELPKGFVFQAETQVEEEGKFSLKWTKSY